MKVFISSLISGFEEFRAAASTAVQSLGHQVIKAEEFLAAPTSPQIACLTGIREADLVVMLLGSRYGDVQSSGRSATHEEFEEAAGSKPLFVFIQTDVPHEPQQTQFVSQVRGWATGTYTGSFSNPESLRNNVIKSIHQWEISTTAGQVAPDDLEARALSNLPDGDRRSGAVFALAVSIVPAPRQSVIRPSQLEAPTFSRDLAQRALFGNASIFSTKLGTQTKLENHALVLSQDQSIIRIFEDGSLQFTLAVGEPSQGLPAVIEEDVREAIDRVLEFGAQTLDLVDSTERLSHVAPAVKLINASYAAWRTRREHEKSPNSMTLSHRFAETSARITLSPPHFSRAAFRQKRSAIAEDFTVLLRRHYRS